jgi:hypothetical protein
MHTNANTSTNAANVVASYPAYDVVERKPLPAYRGGVVELRDTETVALAYQSRNHGTMFRIYRVGTVVSYALRSGECPIHAYEQSTARNEETHWLNPCATMITAERRAKETHVHITIGQTVRIEGRLFRIEQHRNSREHLTLVQVQAPEGML